jgi:hypothetical protein
MKNAIFWDVTPCGSCKTDISEERITSIFRENRTIKLGAALTVTSNVPLKHWFLQEPHSVTSQKKAFFIVTAMKASNLTPGQIYAQ